MAIDLGQLQQSTTTLSNFSSIAVVTPKSVGYQPQNFASYVTDTSTLPPKFLFNFEQENNIVIASEITDHYLENNTSIQDHATIKPIIVKVSGVIGELNDLSAYASEEINIIENKLVAVSQFAPEFSTSALNLLNSAKSISSSILNTKKNAQQAFNNFNNSSNGVNNGATVSALKNQTVQAEYFQKFYGYWQSRTFFTIQTPWAILKDMMIESVSVTQREDSRFVSEFDVTFKQVRFVKQLTTQQLDVDFENWDGRGENQASSEVDLGNTQLVESVVP